LRRCPRDSASPCCNVQRRLRHHLEGAFVDPRASNCRLDWHAVLPGELTKRTVVAKNESAGEGGGCTPVGNAVVVRRSSGLNAANAERVNISLEVSGVRGFATSDLSATNGYQSGIRCRDLGHEGAGFVGTSGEGVRR